MFADDTNLITSRKRVDNILNVGIGHTSKWLECNKLVITIDNCETMFFGCGKPSNILLDKPINPYKTSVKTSGVHFDKNVRFREHINYVTKKLSQFCSLVYRIRSLYPRKFLLMFYKSFAQSTTTYGLLVDGTAAKTNLMKFENAQRRIITAIFFWNKFETLIN